MNFLHRTWAEIDESALIHNLKIIKKQTADCRLMAVVKADAYGHSARIVAPLMAENGVDSFAVSNIEEAITLRGCGIKEPILILGYTPVSMAAQLCLNDISQCVYSAEYAAALSAQAVHDGITVKVHIKLDTGMGRIGFDCRSEELHGLNEALAAANLPNFTVEGIFTHFAVSDRIPEEEDGFTDAQYRRFSAAVEKFHQAGIQPPLCHCCNSAALCLDTEKHSSLCRAGIILYGLKPSSALLPDFHPVMTVKSVVSMVKNLSAGETVSYGKTFTADRNMRIATVTAGYADGYPRQLSGRGEVLIRGKRAPIVGRICMDQMMVDVSEIDGVQQGDEVILFGPQLPIDELASLCNTIHYELVCGISPRVPRIAVKSGLQ
ncbi:MAG: alanine racemase [Clostridia bacterium]|nr:alanine racemase [Clostridia bacterium]